MWDCGREAARGCGSSSSDGSGGTGDGAGAGNGSGRSLLGAMDADATVQIANDIVELIQTGSLAGDADTFRPNFSLRRDLYTI